MTTRKSIQPKSLKRQIISLPLLLNSRQLYGESLKKQILNSLVNGYYMMNSAGEIANINDYITSLQIAPENSNLLLYSTMRGRLRICKIQEVDYEKEFIVGDECSYAFTHPVLHSQWFPHDSGMLHYIDPGGLTLVDVASLDFITQMKVEPDETLHHSDWNSQDPNLIALAFHSPRVRLYDIRSEDAPSTFTLTGPTSADRQHDKHRKVTRVYWSPLDETGIFVSDTIGDIFFYDTRHLKRPVGQKRADDACLFLPVVYLGLTPDCRNLITAHENASHITQWDFQPKKAEFLSNTNVHYQTGGRIGGASGRSRSQPISASFKITLFSTMDRLYAPNSFRVGPDIHALNRRTGAPESEYDLSHPEGKRPVHHVIGFRRTKFGDDPNPALIYTTNTQIVVSRMMTHSEPLPLEEDQDAEDRRKRNAAQLVEHEDRWSDSD